MKKLILLAAAGAFLGPALISSASAQSVSVRVGEPGLSRLFATARRRFRPELPHDNRAHQACQWHDLGPQGSQMRLARDQQ